MDTFDLRDFLPYLLNAAAEEAGQGFQKFYKERYGLLRSEWRVIFHLGRYGDLTATQVCAMARLHKTKVSRAVASLESRRFLARAVVESDRRQGLLTLTSAGRAAYDDLSVFAQRYDESLTRGLTRTEQKALRSALTKLAKMKS